MKSLNRITSSMPSSGIRKIMVLSSEIKDCIHLEVGQPDFRTPEHILEAVAKAAHDGHTRYTAGNGIIELREAIVKKLEKKNGIKVGTENIVVSPGAVCSIFTSLLALVEPGDEVLLSDPCWPNYTMQMGCLGAEAIRYPLIPEKDFRIDFDALEDLVTQKTKVMIINSPNNPTGTVLPKEDMKKAVEFALEYDLYLISDEVYEEIIFEGKHASSAHFDEDGRVITVFGFSKTYAVTGLRVGYAVASEELAKLITKLQEPVVSCPSSISQKACIAALEGPQNMVTEMVKAYKERRDAVVDILKKKGLYLYSPKGAFYILIDISSTGIPSDDFALELLDKKVAVAPGKTFGDTTDGFVRVSLATEKEYLVKGVTILCDTINKLAKK